jgi:hypothetical protein
VTARVFALVVIGWLWLGAVLPAGAASLTHTLPQWQAIGRGLAFTQVEVLQDGEVAAGLAVVKIDPASNAFRVFHGAPQAITVWQEVLAAPIVFNGSYYTRDGQPCGLVIADGKPIGPTGNRQMRTCPGPPSWICSLPALTLKNCPGPKECNPFRCCWTIRARSR